MCVCVYVCVHTQVSTTTEIPEVNPRATLHGKNASQNSKTASKNSGNASQKSEHVSQDSAMWSRSSQARGAAEKKGEKGKKGKKKVRQVEVLHDFFKTF